MHNDKTSRRPDRRHPPSTPLHPGNDPVMPPYTPGGVPRPDDGQAADRPGKGEKPAPSLPPKRAP